MHKIILLVSSDDGIGTGWPAILNDVFDNDSDILGHNKQRFGLPQDRKDT